MKADQKRWDKRFGRKEFALGKEPNAFLKKNIHLLPKGKALDIATGEGRNAVFLAEHYHLNLLQSKFSLDIEKG
jgi:tellurite methyltransferase